MARNTLLTDAMANADFIFQKYKFVLENFPDCKIQKTFHGFITEKPVFISKMVNSNYTDLAFTKNRYVLNVVPYCKLLFEYDNKSEDIIINSSPKRSRLCRVSTVRTSQRNDYFRVIKFSRLSFNLKNNDFDDKMLNDCRTQIMSFIKDNSDCKIDDKHLEPRLKKLLVFT